MLFLTFHTATLPYITAPSLCLTHPCHYNTGTHRTTPKHCGTILHPCLSQSLCAMPLQTRYITLPRQHDTPLHRHFAAHYIAIPLRYVVSPCCAFTLPHRSKTLSLLYDISLYLSVTLLFCTTPRHSYAIPNFTLTLYCHAAPCHHGTFLHHHLADLHCTKPLPRVTQPI